MYNTRFPHHILSLVVQLPKLTVSFLSLRFLSLSRSQITPYYPSLRGYLHCTPGNTGSVTFAYVNVAANTTYELDLAGLNTDGTKMDVSTRVESVTTPAPVGCMAMERRAVFGFWWMGGWVDGWMGGRVDGWIELYVYGGARWSWMGVEPLAGRMPI